MTEATVAVSSDILNIIRADATPACRFDDIDTVLGIRTAVPGERIARSDDLAVFAYCGLNPNMQTLTDICILELVFTRVGQFDGTAGAQHCQRDYDTLERSTCFAAEAAADRFADDADLVQGEVERFGKSAADSERRLAGRPDGQLAVWHILRCAGMRLDRHVLYMRNIEAVVEYLILKVSARCSASAPVTRKSSTS